MLNLKSLHKNFFDENAVELHYNIPNFFSTKSRFPEVIISEIQKFATSPNQFLQQCYQILKY